MPSREVREDPEDPREESEIEDRVLIKLASSDPRLQAELQEKLGDELEVEPLFPSLAAGKLDALVARARARQSGFRPPDLLSYVTVEVASGEQAQHLANAASRIDFVQYAVVVPRAIPAAVVPGNDPRFPNQTHLHAAPDGVDAVFAWPHVAAQGGGDGTAQELSVVDGGWDTQHEDLAALNPILWGDSKPSEVDHGNGALGLACAVDNSLGGVGLVPNVGTLRLISYYKKKKNKKGKKKWKQRVEDAIAHAALVTSAGGVLLLEVQWAEIEDFSLNVWQKMPAEAFPPVHDIIRLASAAGIVVVEAAGNGYGEITPYADVQNRTIFDPRAANFAAQDWDSGAILVGASTSGASRVRSWNSNFGPRIDCHAVGEQLDTLDASGYVSSYGGTSGAAAIIAGVAVAMQGFAQLQGRPRLDPTTLRGLLRDPANGTSPDPASEPHIKRMPDLRIIGQGYFGLP